MAEVKGWRRKTNVGARTNRVADTHSAFVSQLLKDISLGDITARKAYQYCRLLVQDGVTHPDILTIAHKKDDRNIYIWSH
eukprot:7810090-Karenia_brevis.AAC.1